jgi:pre-mRNA-splicing factor SYF1
MTATYLKTALPQPLESSKLQLLLARRATAGTYTPEDGQSAYHLLVQWLEGVEANAEEVGLDWDETVAERARLEQIVKDKEAEQARVASEGARVEGKLMRIDGPMKVLSEADVAAQLAKGGKKATKEQAPYVEEEDPSSTRRLDVEKIVLKDGLGTYKDQAGRLWTGLATYWIKRGEFERVRPCWPHPASPSRRQRDR